MNYELIRARPEGPCQLNIALPTHFLAHPQPTPSSILWDVRGKQKWRGTKMIVYVKFGTRHAYNKPQKSKGASGWGI